ncbi:hypothetical protein MAPG_00057 [Magnaporthiopsis poae ATCC 64411]|uniref:Uncharacterized protein n=1 Tax=Magnaporthiopsis poae (strain ATCC 64411 / 73-15) TaxID=644358 RepID=A0A0C4DJZ6_MAGP6|nr:hypothetical protein MAPG_00057 [Magnaporthiopsis poae ATCC 64411]
MAQLLGVQVVDFSMAARLEPSQLQVHDKAKERESWQERASPTANEPRTRSQFSAGPSTTDPRYLESHSSRLAASGPPSQEPTNPETDFIWVNPHAGRFYVRTMQQSPPELEVTRGALSTDNRGRDAESRPTSQPMHGRRWGQGLVVLEPIPISAPAAEKMRPSQLLDAAARSSESTDFVAVRRDHLPPHRRQQQQQKAHGLPSSLSLEEPKRRD